MTRELVKITDDAKEYINRRCNGTSSVLCIKINSKGCSGHQYEYQLIDLDGIGPMDELITWQGGGLAISAASVMYLIGSILDIKRTGMEEYLHWENPNAGNHCGCGESFSLKG